MPSQLVENNGAFRTRCHVLDTNKNNLSLLNPLVLCAENTKKNYEIIQIGKLTIANKSRTFGLS